MIEVVKVTRYSETCLPSLYFPGRFPTSAGYLAQAPAALQSATVAIFSQTSFLKQPGVLELH
jgi:hypothetical protein